MAGPDADLEAFLQTACAEPATGALDLQESIAPELSRPDRVLARLAELAGLGAGGFESQLRYQKTLGEGGMGLVRLAEQRSMGRLVAVKSVRETSRNDRADAGLVREAWLTGSLEHPNIVPVYDVGVDASGRPLVVLKRIEGAEWSTLIGDAGAVRARFGGADLLEWNLGILIQVIQATRFAHRQGVVHRDLKPSNVMIGEFGEVYVLDWGIAVALAGESTSPFASAADALEPAGTPAYMAPEMLRGGPITRATDVYLIGAILHEIVTGRPPHGGATAAEVIDSILASAPRLADDVPDELAAVLRRALAADASDRYPSLDQLLDDLRRFLEHRSSARLTDNALERLERLRTMISQAKEGTASDGDLRATIYGTFSECRFAFREALASWSDNQAAREGLRLSIIAMIDLELASNEPRAARNLLSELDDPPVELVTRVDEAQRSLDQRRARLDRLDRLHDKQLGWRTRTFVILVVGVATTIAPLVFHYGARFYGLGFRMLTWATLVQLALVIALFYWGRESLGKTSVNRRIAAAILFLYPAQLVLIFGIHALAVPATQAIALALFLWFVIAGMVAIQTSKWLLPLVFGYMAAFLIACVRTDMVFVAMSVANFVMGINASYYSYRLRGAAADGASQSSADGSPS